MTSISKEVYAYWRMRMNNIVFPFCSWTIKVPFSRATAEPNLSQGLTMTLFDYDQGDASPFLEEDI